MKFEYLIYLTVGSILTFFVSSCAVEPVPIGYGKDACHFCKMTIVDNQHAAEIVTKKGKAFKYDAIECMMQSRFDWQEAEIGLFLLADYATPGKLVDATKATFLISESLPSPMGGNLSGFENESEAREILQENGGEIIPWEQLKTRYSKK
ncbi:MAG: nitrous oxide reductase accessory protein NosL [Saprospiraceae bacterium]|nr:nitrous oxide reductase accessory protein NosL [Saprospiraceae bacterium]MCB9326629.1 nitrous oxide reductase accessory protein NosL [Lewinellaceae bacterium]